MVSGSEWVQVNVVAGGGARTAWVTRYRLAPRSVVEEAGLSDIAADHGMEGRTARVAAAARPSVEDVIEASQYVEEEGVSAWIAELGLRFELDADRLIRMADAGVSEDVIDMVVAVSYPSHFAVDRERYSPGYGPTYSSFGGWGFSQPLYSSRFFSPYGYCSPYRYGFGYGGCGYRGYGYGGYGYGGYRSPVIIVIDGSGSGGRVVNGQGYRRAPSSGTGGRVASPRGYVGGSSGSSAGSRSSTEPSRGTSTGRKAKRKDGGG